MYVYGPTNCGKTFMLLPLAEIYTAFSCPGEGTYSWLAAPEKEIIFLNDLRYEDNGEKRVMDWGNFLNLLEGNTLNIGRPKNLFSSDYEWTKRTPVFATSDKLIARVTKGVLDVGEKNQMEKRWRNFEFKRQYKDDEVDYKILACGRCFAQLVLEESEGQTDD